MVIPNGKTVTTILIPYVFTYPKRWVIHVKWYVENKDKWKYHEYFVDEEKYKTIDIGQYYDGTDAYDEEPYTKERE